MLHGHCVGLGCVAAARICRLKGLLTWQEEMDIRETMERFGISVTVNGLSWDAVYQATKSDKKMDSGSVNLYFIKKSREAMQTAL